MKSSKNNKAVIYFTLLGIIFVGPLIIAWLMYNSPSFIPEALPNGQLIQPPLDLKKLPLLSSPNQNESKTWRILYLNPNHCEKSCQDILYKIRQIRIALGKDAPRVERMILTVSAEVDPSLQQLLTTKYQGTDLLITDIKDLTQFLAPLPTKTLALTEGSIYLVDPLNNIMMSYPPDAKPREIFNDLKRLLKVSQIG